MEGETEAIEIIPSKIHHQHYRRRKVTVMSHLLRGKNIKNKEKK
jgi:hypothetical protein